jgi:two-component system, sensor histidine kinase
MQVETENRAVEPPRGGLSVTQQALDAQTALLPYAIAFFAVSLPAYVWAGSYAYNAVWMSGSFAIFAGAWGVFYAVVNWLKQPVAQANVALRGKVHIFAGLFWALAVAQIAVFADQAGPAREPLMLMALAASTVIIFFSAPWLPSLLIVGTGRRRRPALSAVRPS